MHIELKTILEPAYRCEEFDGACKGQAVWNPESGQFPRGYYGALGNLHEVRLVMILAEPGRPSAFHTCPAAGAKPEAAYEFTRQAYMEQTGRGGKGHAIVRDILTNAFPGLTLPEIMRRVWITEAVLCSATSPLARIPARCERTCASKYLVPQLRLFPQAIIATMGTKAYNRVLRFATGYQHQIVQCHNPFGYRGGYSPTWTKLAAKVRKEAK